MFKVRKKPQIFECFQITSEEIDIDALKKFFGEFDFYELRHDKKSIYIETPVGGREASYGHASFIVKEHPDVFYVYYLEDFEKTYNIVKD